MAELNRSDTVTKAIVAAQEEAATIPLREDDNDDETIHALTMDTPPTIDTSMFDVFTDFDLDLTCLSRPGSPSPSTSEMPPTTPSPPSSPSSSTPQLSRSLSFASHVGPLAGSLTTTKKTSKKSSSQHLSATAPSSSRGSWPLIRYAGRGTPIDRNRRLEWGGFLSEEVAEDGLLFSTVRSTSLDSAVRPSQRSISPEWTYASPLSSSVSHSEHSARLSSASASSHSQTAEREPPPEIAPIQGLGLDKSDEWDSIMKTVLSSSNTDLSSAGGSGNAAEKDQDVSGNAEGSGSGSAGGNVTHSEHIVQLSPEHLEQINTGLEMDLGLSKALDLGLGQHGGMNWFALGLLPSSGASGRASGRESPSVYSSQAATPRASIHGSEHASEHRSTTSTKAGAVNDPVRDGLKVETTKWWQKMLLRLRRVHNIMSVHKNRF